MRYEITNQSVTFFLENPVRASEAVATQSFAGTNLSERQIRLLADSLLRKLQGQSLESQRSITSDFLRPLFAFFRTTGESWPTTSAEWQVVMLHFFQFYLTDANWSKAGTKYRIDSWNQHISGLFEFFVEQELIPRDVKIPKIPTQKIHSLARDQPLLGQPNAKAVSATKQPQKLLMAINFGMTDADYLDAVENQCRHLVNVIRNTCMKHWDALMQDAETGRKLAEQVSDNQILDAINTQQFGTPRRVGGAPTRYASPAHPQALNWALAIVRQRLANGDDIGCISINTLRALPFFPKMSFCWKNKSQSYCALDPLTAMKPEQWQKLTLPAQFYRFAGLLSNIDVASVCCLLTIEHPEFTSESLRHAKLLDVHGKPYLLLTDSNEHSILSVDKPRAGQRKSVVLSPLSKKLVMDILRLTAPVREVLRRAGDKTWRYLFLGLIEHAGGKGCLGIVEGKCTYLAGHSGTISLQMLYPEFAQNGLIKGSFDYRRLRNTLGVLRWFETGSVREMSRCLGNTYKVAIENYLPPALLHLWNTRIIRRFQNTLIVLASHDEPYLLEITDFSNLADLQHFVAQLISDYPARTSPLADEVQSRLGTKQRQKAGALALMPGLLSIRLSPISLGLLYSYSALALRTLTSEKLDKVDVLSGLKPRQFTDMATLLRHAAESDKIHFSLRESLDVPLLKRIHGQALAIKISLDAQFAKLAVKHSWTEEI